MFGNNLGGSAIGAQNIMCGAQGNCPEPAEGEISEEMARQARLLELLAHEINALESRLDGILKSQVDGKAQGLAVPSLSPLHSKLLTHNTEIDFLTDMVIQIRSRVTL